MTKANEAPGAPGAVAHWGPARKSGIGTAVSGHAQIWFTTAHGVVSEVFHPKPDQSRIGRLGFVVTGPDGFHSDESSDAIHELADVKEAAALVRLVNTCARGRYRLSKEVLCDPDSAVVMQRVRFEVLDGDRASHRLFCVLELHLGDEAKDDRGCVGEHKGIPMFFGEGGDGIAVALACSHPWLARSAGFAGTSDGLADLEAHGHLTHVFERAEHGHVVLVGEIDPAGADGAGGAGGDLVLTLAFGRTKEHAGHAARGSMLRGYAEARSKLIEGWQQWCSGLEDCRWQGARPRLWTRSAIVLKTLESKSTNGGRVAGLSTPWGPSKGPGSDGTYHLVWTRDLTESVGGLLCAGASHEARMALHYLRCTQEADGHWPQNMRIDGRPIWDNDELDESALPILFLELARRECPLDEAEVLAHWPMVRAAAGFIARRGPSTTRDRWEDVAGVTPFTIATEIAALLFAAAVADLAGAKATASFLRDLADDWNEAVDTLLYRRGGALAEHVGVEGYYVRTRALGTELPAQLDLANLPKSELSPDALALVRFGLRAADDPRITSTVRVIDSILKTDFPGGPAWRRYPGDEYGEHADGAPFDGHGIGRPWPLFTGERAHYELARGRRDLAASLLTTLESFSDASGFLSEQIWDAPDLRAHGLERGRATRSASPLGWAHAEYIKLCRSLERGHVFDMPEHAYHRYLARQTRAHARTWRAGTPWSGGNLRVGTTLRVAVACAAQPPPVVTWSIDGAAERTCAIVDSGVGLQLADIEIRGAGELRVQVRREDDRQGSDARSDREVSETFTIAP